MTYIDRMVAALDAVAADPDVALASVYWSVVPRDQRRFPMLVWRRTSGAVLEGMRHEVVRPVIRLSLIGDYDACGGADFDAVESVRKAVGRALECARVLADWPDEPVDAFDETLSRPRVDWLISLRGE